MQTFLYSLCIEPLEGVMRAVLEAAFAACGSWGLSLILLSAAVNLALVPLYHLAEGWQEDERTLQRRMAPKLSEIKSVYRGRERYMFIRALYRMHGYRPVMAARTSLGLLIQVPFFFAAYHLLNNAPALSGQSFCFLHDLGRPDGLLALAGHSINALPFVMTGVNLFSAAVYSSRLSRAEKIQLYGLAALFLALLYTASAALLIYWTCNNIFSLGKNWFYKRYVYADTRRAAPAWWSAPAGFFAACRNRLGRLEKTIPPFCMWMLCLLCLGAIIALRSTPKGSALSFALMGAASIPGLAALTMHLCRFSEKSPLPARQGAAFFILFAAAALLGAVYGLTSPASFPEHLLRPYAFGLAAAITSLFLCLTALGPCRRGLERLCALCGKGLAPQQAPALFTAAVLVMAGLLFFYTPALLYASDSSFFYEPLAALCGSMVLYAGLFALAWLLVFRAAGSGGRPVLAVFTAFLAAAMLLYVFAAPGDYGALDGFVFEDRTLFRASWTPLVDAAVLAGAGGLAFVMLRAGKDRFAVLLRAFFLVLCLMTGWELAGAPHKEAANAQDASRRLPAYTERLFSFSRDGNNILIIMLDMFTGGHLGDVLKDEPDLAGEFPGFTWYPDSLSPGGSTSLSMPAMLGGEGYTPEAVNARTVDSLIAETNRAYAVLPGIFGPRGYDVAYGDVENLRPEFFAGLNPGTAGALVVGRRLQSDFIPYWRGQKGLPDALPQSLAPFLASVGLFRASPWAVRKKIYNEGAWLSDARHGINLSEGSLAMLDSLPAVSSVSQSGNTLKCITSLLTHYPWQIDAERCMPVPEDRQTKREDGVIIEHLASERCAMRALGRWMRWMRDNGVYDNTHIIIASDHGYHDSAQIRDDFVPPRRKMPWRPHALLMVKPGDAQPRPLQTDWRPMSGTDIIALICRENGPCPGVDQADPLAPADGDNARIRSFVSGYSVLFRHEQAQFSLNRYRISGSAFVKENWTELLHE